MIVDDWDAFSSDGPRSGISDRAERALIGALLITNNIAAAEGLTPAMFRSRARGHVLAAIHEAGPDFDCLTIAARLEREGVPAPGGDWVVVLAACLDDTSADLVREYARVIREAWIDRRVEARTATS
jgi:replicative DNA helicase